MVWSVKASSETVSVRKKNRAGKAQTASGDNLLDNYNNIMTVNSYKIASFSPYHSEPQLSRRKDSTQRVKRPKNSANLN